MILKAADEGVEEAVIGVLIVVAEMLLAEAALLCGELNEVIIVEWNTELLGYERSDLPPLPC